MKLTVHCPPPALSRLADPKMELNVAEAPPSSTESV